ncbi:hypothetical protein ALC57_08398 [Trachymyrmex cornetzi]|uniref:Uncharacterized protein n=1 Tax=Trachymyrmex cornetzi TaxID=471704 RepID=A0A195E2B7_9HYME|nr:hypothetical protein ALC57_08398 [Trachymyrmex cornetzi]
MFAKVSKKSAVRRERVGTSAGDWEIDGAVSRAGREILNNRLHPRGHGEHATAALSVLMRNNTRNCCFEPAIQNACFVCVGLIGNRIDLCSIHRRVKNLDTMMMTNLPPVMLPPITDYGMLTPTLGIKVS